METAVGSFSDSLIPFLSFFLIQSYILSWFQCLWLLWQREQEVNQRSIISQPAPGGKGASLTAASPLSGPLPGWEPLTP